MRTTETWRTTAPNRSPQQIAQQFADELYPGRHVVEFFGEWDYPAYRGSFQLRDGLRTYAIIGNRLGEYEVPPVDPLAVALDAADGEIDLLEVKPCTT